MLAAKYVPWKLEGLADVLIYRGLEYSHAEDPGLTGLLRKELKLSSRTRKPY